MRISQKCLPYIPSRSAMNIPSSIYHLVIYSELSHWKWWSSIAMLVITRGYIPYKNHSLLWFSYGFPMVFLWKTDDSNQIFHGWPQSPNPSAPWAPPVSRRRRSSPGDPPGRSRPRACLATGDTVDGGSGRWFTGSKKHGSVLMYFIYIIYIDKKYCICIYIYVCK